MSEAAEGAQARAAVCQPFTFGGVAAFARGRLGRVLATEFAAGVLVALCAVWFWHRSYCPVILEAIQKMPETARVAEGTLQGVTNNLIAECKFLAIAATPEGGGQIGQDADLQIRFRQNDICAGSIFWPDWGWVVEYGRGTSINLSRSNLEPWWSAWQPVLLASAGGVTVLSLMSIWALLAWVYAAPVKFLGWFADRQVSWGGAWRLASAALMPGTVVMTWALLLYAWGVIDLAGLSFFFAVHVVIGWVYIVGGTLKVSALLPDESKSNPFIT